MIIKSSQDGVQFEFSQCEGRNDTSESSSYSVYSVTLRDPNMWAKADVYALEPFGDGIPEFFDDLSKNWRGFEGQKRWASLEGELEIVCRSDSTGHFTLEIVVQNNLEMRCQNTIYLESGQLESVAKDIRAFFNLDAH